MKPQITVDNEEFRKVFERPFAAPLPSESAPQSLQVPTSHYDYNFDEKDYKCELLKLISLILQRDKRAFFLVISCAEVLYITN